MRAIGAVFLAIGRGLDWVRKFLHLILLLLLFGFIVGALRVSSPVIPAKAALVIAPEGEIVEQLSGDPIQRAIDQARGTARSETLLRDLTDSIRAAANDKRIPVLVIDTEYFYGRRSAHARRAGESDRRVPQGRQESHRVRHGVREGAVLPGCAGERDLRRPAGHGAHRRVRGVPHVLQGRPGQGGRRHQHLPGRRLQERSRAVQPDGSVARSRRRNRRLPEFAVEDVSGVDVGGSQAASRHDWQLRRHTGRSDGSRRRGTLRKWL